MTAQDLPDSHVRIVFAVALFRDHLISATEFRHECVAAFGPTTGHEVADVVLRALAPAATRQ